jgi:acyl-CoA synthetase (AMP-forming)/AMP-acid ligase II
MRGRMGTGSQTMADLIGLATARHGGKPALKHKVGGEWVEVSYQQLEETVRELALGLVDLGIEPGDRVSILSHTRPEWTYACFATFAVGAVAVSIYWGEMLGGPDAYSRQLASVTHMVRIHSGNGPHPELDAATERCFALALDDAGIPDDERLRSTLIDWFAWSNRVVNHTYERPELIPDELTLPHTERLDG